MTQLIDPATATEAELLELEGKGPQPDETPKPDAGGDTPPEKKPDEKKAGDVQPPEPPQKKREEMSADEQADFDKKEAARKGYERRQKEREERQAEKKRVRDLELENLRLKAEKFEKLTDDELQELRTVDPDEYIKYKEKLALHEKDQAILADAEKAHGEEDAQMVALDFRDRVWGIAAQMAGIEIDPDAMPDDHEGLPDTLKNFMVSDTFKAFCKAVDEIFPDIPKGTYPTTRQLELVANDLNRGKTVAQAADHLKSQIQKAGQNRSPLNDKAPVPPNQHQRDWSKLTPGELDGLSEKEMAEYQGWVEQNGLLGR